MLHVIVVHLMKHITNGAGLISPQSRTECKIHVQYVRLALPAGVLLFYNRFSHLG